MSDAIKKELEVKHIMARLFSYIKYRNALVLLEKYELLEEIDIKQHMNIEQEANE